jgi:hypothetical protein
MIVNVAARSGLLDTDCPIEKRVYGYHRLEDPDILVVDDEKTYRQIKLSVYNKLLYEEQLKNITEVRTVMDSPPEAKRY